LRANCSSILERHASNVILAEQRDIDFSTINFSMDEIADAYANAVANSKTETEMDYNASLLLGYAKYYKEKTGSELVVHYCRGLLNQAVQYNENRLTKIQKLKIKWRNPHRVVPREYIDFPD